VKCCLPHYTMTTIDKFLAKYHAIVDSLISNLDFPERTGGGGVAGSDRVGTLQQIY